MISRKRVTDINHRWLDVTPTPAMMQIQIVSFWLRGKQFWLRLTLIHQEWRITWITGSWLCPTHSHLLSFPLKKIKLFWLRVDLMFWPILNCSLDWYPTGRDATVEDNQVVHLEILEMIDLFFFNCWISTSQFVEQRVRFSQHVSHIMIFFLGPVSHKRPFFKIYGPKLVVRYLMNRWLDRIQIHYVCSLGISGGLVNFWDEANKK